MAYLNPHRLPLGFDSKGKVLSPTWALNVPTNDEKCWEMNKKGLGIALECKVLKLKSDGTNDKLEPER
jgi:hypothetical protein